MNSSHRVKQILMVVLIFFIAPCFGGIGDKHYNTDDLWKIGLHQYNKGKSESSDSQAVGYYVDALAYLSAYYQRSPELATSNSAHAKSVRNSLLELIEYLETREAAGGVKGDIPGETTTTKPKKKPKGNLKSPSKKNSKTSGVFKNPKVSGKRLDWCFKWGKECGKPAAKAFCSKHEFRKVSSFIIDKDIGSSNATRVLSTNQICKSNFCDGFKEIICTS